MDAKNILVTGPPGCGKTTLVEQVVRLLELPAVGFITREIREGGRRLGFFVDTLDGKREVLAHIDFESPHRVGKYGVRLETIDDLLVTSIRKARPDEIVVVDEIGKMECLSPLFRKAILDVLDSPNVVFGSIAQKGDAFIRSIKSRVDVFITTIPYSDREQLITCLPKSLRTLAAR